MAGVLRSIRSDSLLRPGRLEARSYSRGSIGLTASIPSPEDESEKQSDDECGEKSALELLVGEGELSPVAPKEKRLARLQELVRGSSGKYENLMDIISDKKTLLAAYQRLKAKPGVRIPELGSQQLPFEWLNKTREALLAGSYDFRDYNGRSIVRRFGARATQHTFVDRYTLLLVHLWALRTKRGEIFAGRSGFYVKKNPDPLRDFTLDFFLNYGLFSKFRTRKTPPYPPVGDLIVQEAMNIALQKIYEPMLEPSVHGYRPNKGCHTLFEHMRGIGWLGVCWLLEFSFKSIFEKMDRSILAALLEEEIEDQGFVELVLKLLDFKSTMYQDVKYSPKMLRENPKLENLRIEYKELGIKTSVLAPVICHIYLRKLDQEIHRIEEEQERIPPERKRKSIFFIRANRSINPTRELPINVKYARYLDEFVVGVGGSRLVVERIQKLILRFLKSELRLVPEYAAYSDISHGSSMFMGMRITAAESTFNPRTDAKRLEKRRRCRFRNMKLRAVRERAWGDRVKGLTLHAWANALRKVSLELPSLERCHALVTAKSERMVRDFAIAELKRGQARVAVEELLNTENAVFYNLSAIGIPDEIVKAYQHLNKLLERHLKSLMIESRERKSRPVALPNNKSRRFELIKTCGALPIRLIAPIDTIYFELRYVGMIKPELLKPDAIHGFLNAPDESIVSFYAAIAYALLSYYRCSDNYIKVKRIVDYQVRWSALVTLAARHDFSVRKTIHEFKRGPQMIKKKSVVASLPSTPAISRMGTMFQRNIEETMLENIMLSSKGSLRCA